MNKKLDAIFQAILRCREDWNAPHWRAVRKAMESIKPAPSAEKLSMEQYALIAAERIGFEKYITELENVLNYEKKSGDKNVSNTE